MFFPQWTPRGFTLDSALSSDIAYETQPEKGFKVVSRESATRGCNDQVAIDSNHRNIVKPPNASSRSYTALKNKFVKLTSLTNSGDLANSPPPTAPNPNCSNAICIAGSNFGSPQVYNFREPDPPARKITVEAGEAAVKILKDAPPGTNIEVDIVGQNGEIDFFSRQILGIFADAKWAATGHPVAIYAANYELPTGGWGTCHGEGLVCYHQPQIGNEGALAIRALAVSGYPCRDLPSIYAPGFKIVLGTRFLPKQ